MLILTKDNLKCVGRMENVHHALGINQKSTEYDKDLTPKQIHTIY